jgi:regulation of enolase protein 1 (concanavalin A-like superfamily)
MHSPSNCFAVRTAILAVAVLVSASSNCVGQQENAKRDFGVLLFDNFNGKMGLAWKPVRHDPTHVSFSERPGMLTIRTQRGTINRDEKAQGWTQARNLFLVENPLPKEADFEVTTCLHRFRPNELLQQAGLLLYNDDDNYLKWIVLFNRTAGVGQVYSLHTEKEAVSEYRHHASPDEDPVWLRVVKRGANYSACASADGKHFQVLEESVWPVDGPTKVGLIAKNGGGLQDALEMDAHFDYFELKSPLEDPIIAGR